MSDARTARSKPDFVVLDRWDPALAQAFARFYTAKKEAAPWQDRWDVSPEYYDWKFAQNPVRPSIVAFARDYDRIVGASSINFRYLRHGNTNFLVGELADLSVAPTHRGAGVFSTIVGLITKQAFAAGAEAIFCIPNKAGAGALIATGQYQLRPQARHATWLAPVKPVALFATKFPQLVRLQSSGRAITGGYGGAKPRYTLVEPEAFVDRFRAAAPDRFTRVPLDADYLRYRIVQYPTKGSYKTLETSDRAGRCVSVIARDAAFRNLPSIVGARIEAGDVEGVRAGAKALRQMALVQDCVFAALWAPLRAAFVLPLLSAGFLPVQQKQIVFANNCAPSLQRLLPTLKIDMLDSDKI